MDSTENLFTKFGPTSYDDWKTKVHADLKGRGFDDTLLWQSMEGLVIQPYYTKEHLETLSSKYKNSPEPTLLAGDDNDWHIIEIVKVHTVSDANKKALEALSSGAASIAFDCCNQKLTKELIEGLLQDIRTDVAPVTFQNFTGEDSSGLLPAGFTGCLGGDSLLHAIRSNTYSTQLWQGINDNLKEYRQHTSEGRDIQALCVDGFVFKEAGADVITELAFTLGLANEYLHGTDYLKTTTGFRFRLASSGNFFFEVAKFRAIRMLWDILTAESIATDQQNIDIYLEARSAVINKSVLDDHTNMLRNTAECMAAVLGGADGILINSHDLLSGGSDEGRRWARNLSLILKHESHLDHVLDPAHGSYYIEEITEKIASAAWDLFKTVESMGGFIKCFESGFIEKKIDQCLNNEMSALAVREKTLVGVNAFPNIKNAIPDFTIDSEGHLKLPQVRLAAKFEKLRLKAEVLMQKNGTRPSAYLLRSGKLSMAIARMNYSANLLGCGGIDCVESTGELTLSEDMEIFESGNFDLLVLCSDDASWPELLTALKGRSVKLWLAGNPSSLPEELVSIIDGSIYMGCNVLQKLEDLLADFSMQE